jgi:hypothetical protein
LNVQFFSKKNFLDDLFYEHYGFIRSVKYVQPMMIPKSVDGVWLSPYNLALEKINKPKISLDKDVLQNIEDMLTDRIVEGLLASGITEIQPLTVEQAINGVEEDAFIRRINASTSAGHGMPGFKRDYMVYPGEDLSHGVLRETASREVSRILECYSRGETSRGIYKCQLKDEPRDSDKVAKGKTRPFYVAPFATVIVQRMLAGPIFSLMVSHSSLFCCALGIDMHTEYDALIKQLDSFSTTGIEIDYGSYDQTCPFDIAWTACSIIHRVAKRFGYNDQALKQLKGVLSDLLFPFVEMNKDVFCAPGLQPSGANGTAELNSLKNVIIFMYNWYTNDKVKHLNFFSYVMVIVYGDDAVAAVKKEVSSYFNNITFSLACKTKMGLECTPASKGEEFQESICIMKTQFLKRTAHYKEDLNAYVALLDMNSIYKSLEWSLPSKSGLPMWEQISATMCSALRELFFHSTRAQYTSVRAKLVTQFMSGYDHVTEEYCAKVFPSYDFLLDFYRKKQQDKYGVSLPALGVGQEETDLQAEDGVLCGLEHKYKLATIPGEGPIVRNPSQFERTSVSHYKEMRDFIALLREEYKEAVTVLEEVPPPVPGMTIFQLKNSQNYSTNFEYRRLVDAYVEASERVRSLDVTINILENNLMNLAREIQPESLECSFVFPDLRPESAEMSDGAISSSVMDEHTNVLDVVGQEDIQSDAGWVTFNPTFSNTPMELNDFLSRPVQISTFTTAPGAYVNSNIDPWSLYLSQPSVRAKLKNYAFLRATMNIKVVVSGTPFHALQALVSYVPLPYANEVAGQYVISGWTSSTFRQRRITWLSQAQGAKLIQVRDNQPVEISAPFVHAVPMIALWKRNQSTILTAGQNYDSVADMGRLIIESPIPATDCASTPTDVSWYVYAFLTDVQLGCPTKTVVEITSESEERERGPVERFATSAKEVADSLTSVPWLNPYAKASSIALGALTRISSFFGWSYPTMNTEPMRMKNEPYRNAANTIGYDLGQRITQDPKQELTVDPRVGGVAQDELSIAYLSGIPSYFTNFTWTQAAASTSPLFKMPIYPGLVRQEGLATAFQQPTALAMTCEPFGYWRGKIKIRFDVVCTQFHRGKIAFVYEPNVGQNVLIDSSGLTLNKQHVFVLDLQEAQTVELCFDWASPRAWLECNGYVIWSSGVDSSSQELFNGYVSVYPMTKLQSPDAGDIYVNVFVSGQDMHYNYYTAAFPDLNWESAQVDDFTCVTINETKASDDHIHELHFGESISSFRSLLKRFALIDSKNTTDTVAIGATFHLVEPTYPTLRPTRTAPSTREVLLLNFLRSAFVGMRGGMRYRVSATQNSFTPTSAIKIYISPPVTSTATTSLSPGTMNHPQRGTVMFVPSTNGGIEFEVPFYSNLLFVAAQESNAFDTNAIPTKFNRNFTVEFEVNGDATAINKLAANVYVAAAEDFTLIRFLGAPPFRVV